MNNGDLNVLAEEIWNDGLGSSFFGKFIGTTQDKPIQIIEDLNKDFGDFVIIPTEPKISSQNLTADEWVKKMNSAPKELWIEINEEILITDEFVARDFTPETLKNTVKNFFSDSVANRLDKIIHNELRANSTTEEKIESGDFSMILAIGDKLDLVSEPRDYNNKIGFQFYRAVGVKQLV
ncbi:MAG: hypothetical protein IK062_04545 [Selenomonadaceae bacterium]|nr:hypothetical protein [Selenomonadaceae bacterium]